MSSSSFSKASWRVPLFALVMSLFITGIIFSLIHYVGSHGPNKPVNAGGEYAKFLRNQSFNDRFTTLKESPCPKHYFRCNSSQICISLDSRCDGVVDCPDAEDEQFCVCAFRMPPAKFCDKYPDCFDQSDESFCAYCPTNSFNCGNGQCIPRHRVCDSKMDCTNAMDENFCFRLSSNIPIASVEDGKTNTPAMSGFLLRNQGGVWYPVCSNPYDAMQDALASHACVSITANPLASSTHQHRKFANFSNYLNKDGTEFIYHYYGRFIHWNGCLTDQGIFVTCDDVLCGFNPRLLLPRPRQARIVGGQPSEPGAWPWHGAVYKNGDYSCGATLISNRWLLSAGHCFHNHISNYYEVQLGMLRRRSFTPHQKVYRISHIIKHPRFSILTLDYDIALLRTAEPVTFDFWVRPICLPDLQNVENSGSICTVIGWGDTGEKADDSDNLQEVHIPLTEVCRKSDRWLCAGFPEGGHDACQGDSGGPLMCLKNDGLSWYIAGVISTGIGCARPRSPGRYTRVSHFALWMRSVMKSADHGDPPLSSCPGWRCSAVGGGSCLPPSKICDGKVDCYDAQDEVKCKQGRKVKVL